LPGGEGGVEYPLMRAPLGEVKRILKILVFFVFLPLFLAPSCKPRDSNSSAAPALDLSAPTGFGATTISKTQIDLAWTTVALDVLNYEIERSVDGGAFAPLTTLVPTATSFSNTGLTSSTQYAYRIRAINGSSSGPWLTILANTILVSSLTAVSDPMNGAPDERMGHSMIYDPIGDQILIFGGLRTGGSATDELWRLTFPAGTPTWTLVGSGTPPGSRFGHCAILDSTYHRMIVHGGTTGAVGGDYDDVFQVDLGSYTWSPLPLNTVSFPFARHGHAAIYDPANQRMLMYGGNDDIGSVEEVWELTLPDPTLIAPANGGTWTDVTPVLSGPGPRSEHIGVHDPSGNRMIVHGGRDATPPPAAPSPDAWALDLGALTWSLIPATGSPAARYGHAAVLNGTRMMGFGGFTTAIDDKLWQLNLAGSPAWFSVSLGLPAPGARMGHAAALRSSTMILFGGGSAPGTPSFMDLWEFSF